MVNHIFQVIATGIIQGNDYVFLSLGLAILYKHSSYIPLWLPEMGAIAAYCTYASEQLFKIQGYYNIVAPLILVLIIGVAIHRFLMSHYVTNKRPYEGLLMSLGVSIVIVNLLALSSGSYSLVFKTVQANWSLYIPPPIDDSIYGYDILQFGGALILGLYLWAFLKFFYWGKRVRAVMANRSLSDGLGISLKFIDTMLLAFVSILVGFSGIFSAMKYDLKPEMMFSTGLKSLVVVLAIGPRNVLSVIVGAYGLGILETFLRRNSVSSLYVDAIVYGAMIFFIILHSTWKTE